MPVVNRYTFAALLVLFTLTACGGGGGGSQNETVTFNITTTAAANGSIDASFTINQGETPRIQITPDPGYIVDTISGCNGYHGAPFLYEIGSTSAITADCTVSVSFTPGYVVTTAAVLPAGATGAATILPPEQAIRVGESATVGVYTDSSLALSTIIPSAGCIINDIAPYTYQTVSITADCTITGTFITQTYQVDTNTDTNGFITPATTLVEYGSTTNFNIFVNSPDIYEIDSVTGCDGTLTGLSYTTGPILGDCSVDATYKYRSFTVSSVIPSNGSITPASDTVIYNDSTSFSITPAAGYVVDTVDGCGGSYDSDTFTYSISAVTADCEISASFVTRPPIIVSALFSNAPNWNDYVQGSDWRTAEASNTACNAATDSACLHGGEYRVVTVNDRQSCNGLTARDDLNAFYWSCDDSAGSARFISTQRYPSAGLEALVDFNAPGFLPNAVTILQNGSEWDKTASTAWWSNTFEINNTGGSLSTASTIYLATSNVTTAFTIDADSVGLLTQTGVSLSGGNMGAGTSIVSSSSHSFLWIEGNIDASLNDNGINLQEVKFSVLKNITSTASSFGSGIKLTLSSHNLLSDISAINNADSGIKIWSDSRFNTLQNIQASNNTNHGIDFNQARYNLSRNLVTHNNSNDGLYIRVQSYNNSFRDVTAGNNGNYGIELASENNILSGVTASHNSRGISIQAPSNILSDITTTNNSTFGVFVSGSDKNSILRLATANNTLDGILLSTTTKNQIISAVSSNNGRYGFDLNNSSNSLFYGVLGAGNNNTDCSVTGGTDPGLDNSCSITASATTMISDMDLSSSFMGKVVTDDAFNTSDSSGGTASFPANPDSFDWGNFSNRYRHWGIEGSDFPNLDQRGRWTEFAGRIWDWSLSLSDSGNVNSGTAALLGVLTQPSFNNSYSHLWEGTPATLDDNGCKDMVEGSHWAAGVASCATSFLDRAVEILGDGIGNENGLCEQNEDCVYTPNIGSYQGHTSFGDKLAPTLINPQPTGVNITGIQLYEKEFNGY